MTREEAYDALVRYGVTDPAALTLGECCVLGRWERIGEVTPEGWIMRSGYKAIQVLGQGVTWDQAFGQVADRLVHYGTKAKAAQ